MVGAYLRCVTDAERRMVARHVERGTSIGKPTAVEVDPEGAAVNQRSIVMQFESPSVDVGGRYTIVSRDDPGAEIVSPTDALSGSTSRKVDQLSCHAPQEDLPSNV